MELGFERLIKNSIQNCTGTFRWLLGNNRGSIAAAKSMMNRESLLNGNILMDFWSIQLNMICTDILKKVCPQNVV